MCVDLMWANLMLMIVTGDRHLHLHHLDAAATKQEPFIMTEYQQCLKRVTSILATNQEEEKGKRNALMLQQNSCLTHSDILLINEVIESWLDRIVIESWLAR